MDIGAFSPLESPPYTAHLLLLDRPLDPTFGTSRYRSTGVPGPRPLCTVKFDFEPFVEDDAPQRITRVTLEPHAHVVVSAADLRQLPWARLDRAARALVFANYRRRPQDWTAYNEAADLSTDAQAQRSRPRGRPPLSAELLVDVARRYQQLCEAGERAPALTIATEHHVNKNTARSWIRQARKKGYLGPAPKGRAG